MVFLLFFFPRLLRMLGNVLDNYVLNAQAAVRSKLKLQNSLFGFWIINSIRRTIRIMVVDCLLKRFKWILFLVCGFLVLFVETMSINAWSEPMTIGLMSNYEAVSITEIVFSSFYQS